MALEFGLSLLIGLMLGLLGGGGSILTVPMLVYVLHIEPKKAIVTSLVVVGASSLVAILPHARRRSVCWKGGFFFGVAGMAGAYGGGRLAAYFPGDALMAMFGMVALVTGLLMLRRRKSDAIDQPQRNLLMACPAQVPCQRILFDGLFVGLLTGIVGVGGGFLIVPTLTLLVGLPMQAAVGTSLLVIVMNAMAGLGGYVNHVQIDLGLTVFVAGGAILGAIAGGLLSRHVSAKALRRLFGLFVILVADYVLFRAMTPQLLAALQGLLERHVEFILGFATFAVVWLGLKMGAWIHRSDTGYFRRANRSTDWSHIEKPYESTTD